MWQHNKRTTPRGDKLKGVKKGRWRVGGILMPLLPSVGSQIMVIPSWWQAGAQKEADAVMKQTFTIIFSFYFLSYLLILSKRALI